MVILYLFAAIVLFYAYKSMEICLLIVLISTMTLFIVPSIKGFNFLTLISLIAIIYLFSNTRIKFKKGLRSFPFKLSFILCFVSYTISSLINEFSFAIYLNSLSDYILVFVLWLIIKPSRHFNKRFILFLTVYILVLCIYGAYEPITGDNPISQDLIDHGMLDKDLYIHDNYERTGLHRTKSITIWCEAYGTICYIALFIFINCYLKKIVNLNVLLLGTILSFVFLGILSTNSRTIMVASVIVLLSILLYFFKNKYSFISIAIIIAGLVFISSDIIQNIYKSIIEINDSGGSSLDLRLSQFNTSLDVMGNNWFGKGLSSYYEFTQKFSTLSGAESIIFTTMIDRGIFGIISLCVLWLEILIYLIRKHEYWLIFLLVGFVFSKIATLAYGISEVYILGFIMCLINIRKSAHIRPTQYLLSS